MVKWEDLQLFEAAARMRGIAAAAKTLHIGQPQLSRRLMRFEDVIGTRLFDRTPNGLMLTPAGERLLPVAQEMREVANKAERMKPELALDARRTVRFSLDEVRERFILQNAKTLKDALPGIQIEVFSSQEHLDHAARETDIQIRSCLPETDTLVARKLGFLTYRVYVAKSYESGENTAPIDDPNWIIIGAARSWYPEITQWFESTVGLQSAFRVNTQTAVLHALEAGAGYGILPEFMGDDSDQLHCVEEFGAVHVSQENLIVHRDVLRDPIVRKTVDAVSALYKNSQKASLAKKTAA
ncbi:MAG: LysR family transcriptional regulator [Paracoccaceae bacterium]|uniref:LysR family transcriptional regulator n=1 Tax=Tateyamaria sp. TaxID=1929288 RepID=UPI00329A831F